jgi:hypothetical protein
MAVATASRNSPLEIMAGYNLELRPPYYMRLGRSRRVGQSSGNALYGGLHGGDRLSDPGRVVSVRCIDESAWRRDLSLRRCFLSQGS